MQTIDLQQGSPAWLAFRAEHFTASDAPAMMGESPYKTRSQLLHEKATGISPEVDAATQRRFDDGHRIEALARPLAEDFIGDDLYPVVGANGKYAASFDGLTMLGNINWECKTLNATLREAMRPDCTGTDLPLVYQIQMEHQAMVSECDRALFTAAQFDAAGNPVDVRHCWYTPNPDLRARIVAGWEQFDEDLASYVPEPAAEPVTAQAQEALPAVFAQVSGSLSITSNLDLFGEALRAFVGRIPKNPETDQEFADTEAACKRLKEAEDALAAAETQALASLDDVAAMQRTVATLKELARQTRLASEKLVKARKEAIRTEIVTTARQQFSAFLAGLQGEIRVRLNTGMPDFASAIKGLKTLSSIKDAVGTALANAKIEANEYAADIRAKLAKFDELVPPEYQGLFRDLDDLMTMAPNHFEAAVVARVEQQKKADDERRQQIEDAAKAKAAAVTPPPAAPVPAAQPTPLHGAHGAVAYTAQGQPASAAAPAIPADDPAALRLGQINERLAPISLSAAGLADLGITHTATDKAAKLYRESDFQRICAALILRISEARTMETV
ncbi:YqaJ viral recombinase family protein [Castellaniella hirudinis]|uniref:YqaJ viral recombinase family protein n=1 Tax=Castellaniella hirudinis TaxID=1144617 RepID=UPI0039C15823